MEDVRPSTVSPQGGFEGLKCKPSCKEDVRAVFEINLLFCAPLGYIHFETMHTRIFLCTSLVYSYDY